MKRMPRLVASTGTYHKLWPDVFAPETHFKRAYRDLRNVKIDAKIKNVRNQQRKYCAQQLDAIMQGLTVPISTLISIYTTGFHNIHPYERTVADLTLIAREKKGEPSLGSVLQQLRELRRVTSLVGKHFAHKANNAASAADAKDVFQTGLDSLSALYRSADIVLPDIESLVGYNNRSFLGAKKEHPLYSLLAIHQALRKVPALELETPSMVLVGAPNVGKSSLVRVLSSGTPEVADYPFTTRGVSIGHLYLEHDPRVEEAMLAMSGVDDPSATNAEKKRAMKTHRSQLKCQVMDTPGLLDRPEEERNEMERLTYASMLHLPTAVMFVLDHAEMSGQHSSLLQQLRIRRVLKERFPKRPWLDVLSKADIPLSDASRSLLKEYGLRPISDLREYVQARQRSKAQSSNVLQPLLWVSSKTDVNIDVLKMEVQGLLHRLRSILAEMKGEGEDAEHEVDQQE